MAKKPAVKVTKAKGPSAIDRVSEVIARQLGVLNRKCEDRNTELKNVLTSEIGTTNGRVEKMEKDVKEVRDRVAEVEKKQYTPPPLSTTTAQASSGRGRSKAVRVLWFIVGSMLTLALLILLGIALLKVGQWAFAYGTGENPVASVSGTSGNPGAGNNDNKLFTPPAPAAPLVTIQRHEGTVQHTHNHSGRLEVVHKWEGGLPAAQAPTTATPATTPSITINVGEGREDGRAKVETSAPVQYGRGPVEMAPPPAERQEVVILNPQNPTLTFEDRKVTNVTTSGPTVQRRPVNCRVIDGPTGSRVTISEREVTTIVVTSTRR